MTFSHEELVDLVERASPLHERLGNAFVRNGRDPDAAAEQRLERWSATVAQGNPEVFERRLRWDGLDVDFARSVLGRVRLRDPARLPAWTATLNGLLEAAAADGPAGRRGDAPLDRCLKAESPLPFEDLLVAFVAYARRELAARSGSHCDLFTAGAHATLERALLGTLADLCCRTLAAEFAVFRAGRQSALFSAARESGEDEARLYRSFIRGLREGRLRVLFQEYCVLARLVATAVACWIDANAELLARFAADREALRAAFQPAADLGAVERVWPNLSDPHEQRRFVVVLGFASGLKIVYKPRDVRLEHAYQRLLRWLAGRGLSPALAPIQVLERDGYGWVEFVERTPCADADDARLYYRRMGTLLCLAYAFDGVDLHAENLVIRGAQPVVVDTEAFFYPKLRQLETPPDGAATLALAQDQIRESVLKTGLLPERRVGPDGIGYDVSGLGGGQAQVMPGRMVVWEHVNTDRMRYRVEATVSQGNPGVPPPDGHLDEVLAGFEDTYRFLIRERDALVAPGGPLAPFAGLSVRFIYRPTRVYLVMMQSTAQPRFLRDGADRSIALDAMGRGLLEVVERPFTWPILRAEHRALEQLDVPRFTGSTDADWLRVSPDECIDGCFPDASYARTIERLEALGPEDLQHQIAFIRGAFLTRVGTGHDGDPGSQVRTGAGTRASDGPAADELLTRDLALEESERIATVLHRLAVRSDDGGATWIGLAYSLPARQSSVRQLDLGLHDGHCGVALFLAALAHITGEAAHRELALAALRPLRPSVGEERFLDRTVKRIGIGGGLGLGSIVYSLVHISRLLDEPRLIADARAFAALITPALVEEDAALDVILGSAGAMLGLLKLYEATGDAAVLRRARLCGDRILERQVGAGERRGGWIGVEGRELSGFSHGAAGIAYSLVRLHAHTGEAALLEAAKGGVASERKFLVREAGNWARSAAPTDQSAPHMRSTWCQGAAGIALARLGMLDAVDDADIREDLEIGLATTAGQAIDGTDHLCCGNLGRAEILFTAGQRLGRPSLREAGLRNAAQVLRRARRRGEYAFEDNGGVYRHGFFQGRAGIGYTLLRMTHPDLLPTVLLWA